MTLSDGARRQISTLLAAQPEAGPWLEMLAAVLQECANPAWDVVAARTRLQPERRHGTPLLAGAEISVEVRLADAWLRRVLDLAGNAGPEAGALRAAANSGSLSPLDVLETAINADSDRLEATAISLGVPPEPLSVAAGLAVIPLLQALRRRFGAAVDPAWHEGMCPVCGDWPLLAELRGLERARRLRCGRCGSDWAQPGVRCPYCAATGHATRAELQTEEDREARKVEVCQSCRGYLKSLSTLRPWAGDEVALADLASVELDLAALEREYERPAARRQEPGARVVAG